MLRFDGPRLRPTGISGHDLPRSSHSATYPMVVAVFMPRLEAKAARDGLRRRKSIVRGVFELDGATLRN